MFRPRISRGRPTRRAPDGALDHGGAAEHLRLSVTPAVITSLSLVVVFVISQERLISGLSLGAVT